MAKGVPEIYSGQEEPVLRALAFFEKDPIHFEHFARAGFYKTLLSLRKKDIALSADAAFKKVQAGDPKSIYAFLREKAGRKVLVILNFSNEEQTISVKDKSLWGNPYNVFMHNKEPLSGRSWKMEPWGYAVYEYGGQ
jgi:glycosidase